MDRFANENIPNSVVQALRTGGDDVLAVKDVMRGADDPTVLARAQSERRLVVTQDKDFGELAFRSSLPAECGIILFRLSGDDPGADIARTIDVIESRDSWRGLFAGLRMTVCESARCPEVRELRRPLRLLSARS